MSQIIQIKPTVLAIKQEKPNTFSIRNVFPTILKFSDIYRKPTILLGQGMLVGMLGMTYPIDTTIQT